MNGALFVISGPAGAGKGTLLGLAIGQLSRSWVSISATTRAPRGTEVDGVEYFFVSVEQFERMIAEEGLLEWAKVHANYYGTPVAPIREHIEQGDAVFLEIDVQGALQVKEKFPQAKLVFIAPPSMEVLEQRLRGRATDSEESILLRLKNAIGEMEASKLYDHIVVNDDLERATAELVEVIKSYVGQ